MTNSLDNITTFRTQGNSVSLIELTTDNQLEELSDTLKQTAFIVLGCGSNVLFIDDYEGCVVINRLRGITVLAEDHRFATVSIAAGENWHEVVLDMNQRGFYGLENLALIPGTMGAAPVQNIGAYGVEIADFIESVIVYDLFEKQKKTLSKADCRFAYRNSLFKTTSARKRWIITTVILKLNKVFSPVLSYSELCNNDEPKTAYELLKRIIGIRQSKLPDPDKLPNAGSFFKNPIIKRSQLIKLQKKFGNMPYFDINETLVKIPAAWLIQQSGFKGIRRENGAGVYDKHALILVNYGNAHGRDIYDLACDIMDCIQQMFTIRIEPEVRIIGIPENEKQQEYLND